MPIRIRALAIDLVSDLKFYGIPVFSMRNNSRLYFSDNVVRLRGSKFDSHSSDYKGTALMLDALPRAKVMLGDCSYDAYRFRAALAERGIAACILSKVNRKVPIPDDTVLYR